MNVNRSRSFIQYCSPIVSAFQPLPSLGLCNDSEDWSPYNVKGKARTKKSTGNRAKLLEQAAKAEREISKVNNTDDSLVSLPSKREARMKKKTERKKKLEERECPLFSILITVIHDHWSHTSCRNPRGCPTQKIHKIKEEEGTSYWLYLFHPRSCSIPCWRNQRYLWSSKWKEGQEQGGHCVCFLYVPQRHVHGFIFYLCRQSEVTQFKNVLEHPVFQANPLAAIRVRKCHSFRASLLTSCLTRIASPQEHLTNSIQAQQARRDRM